MTYHSTRQVWIWVNIVLQSWVIHIEYWRWITIDIHDIVAVESFDDSSLICLLRISGTHNQDQCNQDCNQDLHFGQDSSLMTQRLYFRHWKTSTGLWILAYVTGVLQQSPRIVPKIEWSKYTRILSCFDKLYSNFIQGCCTGMCLKQKKSYNYFFFVCRKSAIQPFLSF